MNLIIEQKLISSFFGTERHTSQLAQTKSLSFISHRQRCRLAVRTWDPTSKERL